MESMMMGDNEDPPTNLVQEVDQPHQENDVGPVSRSYECIFCKRGFTTAQALGGHMNIHRKDRAKTKPNYLSNTYNSSTQEEYSCYTGPRFYQPVFASYPPTYTSSSAPNYHQEGQIRYTSYFASTSNNSCPINHESNHQALHGVITSPSREEKRMSLSLQFGWSLGEDRDSKRSFRDENKEDDLDLELRLGHDP